MRTSTSPAKTWQATGQPASQPQFAHDCRFRTAKTAECPSRAALGPSRTTGSEGWKLRHSMTIKISRYTIRSLVSLPRPRQAGLVERRLPVWGEVPPG